MESDELDVDCIGLCGRNPALRRSVVDLLQTHDSSASEVLGGPSLLQTNSFGSKW